MEQPVIQVVCRDGVPARVQRVKYEGTQGGECFFGYRIPPGLATFDHDGMRNESGDLWSLAGKWVNSMVNHPFDIIGLNNKKQEYAHATTV